MLSVILLVVLLSTSYLNISQAYDSYATQTITTQGAIQYAELQHQRLHTDGSQIKNEANETVVLRGIGWQEFAFQDHLEQDPFIRAAKIKSLGANFVRLWLNWRLWKNPTLGSNYKQAVDESIQACVENNLYIIPSFMSASYPVDSNDPAEYTAIGENPEEWISWCKEIIGRYYNIPGVCGLSVMNEPEGKIDYLGGWTRWRQLAQQCATEISDEYPDILILVPSDGSTWYGRGIEPWVISNPIPVPNVVYTFHRYYYQDVFYRDQDPDYVASYIAGDYQKARTELETAWQDIVFKAMNAGRACINEEFGFEPNRPEYPEPKCDIVMNDTLNLMNKHYLSWCYVAWWFGVYGPVQQDFVTLTLQGQIMVENFQ